jgi:hypothetical protein
VLRLAILTLAAIALAGCREQPKPRAKAAKVIWQKVGSWSGRGDAQTESFDIGYEPYRIRWEAANASANGVLRVILHSAISGRDLVELVDHRGNGHDTSYIRVDPHYSYLTIESKDVDWSVTVEAGEVFSSQTK